VCCNALQCIAVHFARINVERPYTCRNVCKAAGACVQQTNTLFLSFSFFQTLTHIHAYTQRLRRRLQRFNPSNAFTIVLVVSKMTLFLPKWLYLDFNYVKWKWIEFTILILWVISVWLRQSLVFVARTQILSWFQFTKHFIQFVQVCVETNHFVSDNPLSLCRKPAASAQEGPDGCRKQTLRASI